MFFPSQTRGSRSGRCNIYPIAVAIVIRPAARTAGSSPKHTAPSDIVGDAGARVIWERPAGLGRRAGAAHSGGSHQSGPQLGFDVARRCLCLRVCSSGLGPRRPMFRNSAHRQGPINRSLRWHRYQEHNTQRTPTSLVPRSPGPSAQTMSVTDWPSSGISNSHAAAQPSPAQPWSGRP